MKVSRESGKIAFTAGPFSLGLGAPALRIDGRRHALRPARGSRTTTIWRGGRELSDVRWDAKTRTLSGSLHRPPGESGFIMIAVPSAEGLVTRKLALATTADVTLWSVVS